MDRKPERTIGYSLPGISGHWRNIQALHAVPFLLRILKDKRRRKRKTGCLVWESKRKDKETGFPFRFIRGSDEERQTPWRKNFELLYQQKHKCFRGIVQRQDQRIPNFGARYHRQKILHISACEDIWMKKSPRITSDPYFYRTIVKVFRKICIEYFFMKRCSSCLKKRAGIAQLVESRPSKPVARVRAPLPAPKWNDQLRKGAFLFFLMRLFAVRTDTEKHFFGIFFHVPSLLFFSRKRIDLSQNR